MPPISPDPTDPDIASLDELQSLNGLLDHRVRLAICVLLSKYDAMSFSRLKQVLEETDGSLGTHLRKLEDGGYLAIDKTYRGRRPVTWYQLTADGQTRVGAAHREPDAAARARAEPVTATASDGGAELAATGGAAQQGRARRRQSGGNRMKIGVNVLAGCWRREWRLPYLSRGRRLSCRTRRTTSRRSATHRSTCSRTSGMRHFGGGAQYHPAPAAGGRRLRGASCSSSTAPSSERAPQNHWKLFVIGYRARGRGSDRSEAAGGTIRRR